MKLRAKSIGLGEPTAFSGSEVAVQKRISILKNYYKPLKGIALDVGCGAGGYLHALWEDMYKVGIDIQVEGLRKSDKSNLNLLLASADRMPFRNGIFNLFLLIEVLEHLDRVDECLREVERTAKRSTALVSVPNRFYPFETHGMKIGDVPIDNIFGVGIPFMSMFPECIRRKIARARIYSIKDISKLLYGWKIYNIQYMMPPIDLVDSGQDRLRRFLPHGLRRAIQNILSRLERVPLIKDFGGHIIVIAQVRKSLNISHTQ